jgi:hypothetical protein
MAPAPTPELAEAHASWLLAADPEAGLEAFLGTKPPMAPAAVLPILQVCFWEGGKRGVGLGAFPGAQTPMAPAAVLPILQV